MGDYDDIHGNVLHWLRIIAKRCLYKRGRLPVFYDVGAHEGFFSTALSEHCKCVVSFEPDPRSYLCLADAVVLYANITIMQRVLWSRRDEVTLYQYSDPSFDSLAMRDAAQCKHYNITLLNQTNMPAFPLDAIIKEKNLLPPDLIKMDVEGSELMVLEGAKATLKKYRPYIVSEYSADNTENFSYTREDLAKQFASLGYRLFGLKRKDDRRLYRDLSEKSVWNVLAVPM